MSSFTFVNAKWDRILRVLRTISVVFLLVSVTITFVNVVMRYIARAPIYWADELALVTFVAMIYLPLGSVEKAAENLRLTVLFQFCGKRVKSAGEHLRALTTIGMGVYVSVLCLEAVYQSLLLGNKTVALRIPTALIYGVIPVAFLAMAIGDFLFLWNSVSRWLTRYRSRACLEPGTDR